MEITNRPWGSYQTLYTGEDCQVKKIIVKPGERPSYQYHFKRAERWVIVQGSGKVYHDFGEGDGYYYVGVNDIVEIEKEEKHTIENIGDVDLVFIEVQTGEYFGEDDIVRIDDKYGRS